MAIYDNKIYIREMHVLTLNKCHKDHNIHVNILGPEQPTNDVQMIKKHHYKHKDIQLHFLLCPVCGV